MGLTVGNGFSQWLTHTRFFDGPKTVYQALRLLVVLLVSCLISNSVKAQVSAGTYGFDNETATTVAGPATSASWTSSDNLKFTVNASTNATIQVIGGGGVVTGVAGDHTLDIQRSGSGTFTNQIIESNNGSEFGISSLYIEPVGPSGAAVTFQFEGFKDNVSTGTQSASITYASFHQINLSTSGNFTNIDKVVITTTSGSNFGISLDEIVVASAATSAPTLAMVAATALLEGPWNGSEMKTLLKSGGLISLTAPYNTINNHNGSESVTDESDIPADAVDWVLVELREVGVAESAADADDATRVGSAAGFLMNDGRIVATDGTSDLTISLSGNTGAEFFVVVYHRNHLPIMSKAAVTESGGKYSIDLSASANVYEAADAVSTLSGSSKVGMHAGDTDNDGDIDGVDLATWRSSNGAVFSYSGSGLVDFNLDGVINAVDRNDFHQKNTAKTRKVPQ